MATGLVNLFFPQTGFYDGPVSAILYCTSYGMLVTIYFSALALFTDSNGHYTNASTWLATSFTALILVPYRFSL